MPTSTNVSDPVKKKKKERRKLLKLHFAKYFPNKRTKKNYYYTLIQNNIKV